MSDQTFTCRDCRASFVFTTSEREQYASQGRYHAPSRCAGCREARQRDRVSRLTSGDQPNGVNGRRDPVMFPIICVECGKNTQVPFQPRDATRVYCSECHAARRGAAPSRARGRGTW